MNGLLEALKGLGFARLGAIAGVTGLVGAVMMVILFRMASPPMALLYADLEVGDSAKIIEQLRQARIPYRERGNGAALYVPSDRVFELRMQFAQEGLPTGGVTGYELFDRQNALGTTSFQQNINKLRALEGELSRTIASLDSVRAARVHLVLPRREIFSRETTPPSASIKIDTRRGSLSRQQVQAIQYLVASAVDGLTAANVSIIDGQGNLLASGAGTDDNGLAGSAEERRLNLENSIRTRIESMLASVVGPGNARVSVTAEMDFNRIVTESEVYDPESQVMISSTLIEEDNESQNAAGGRGVSVSNNLPEAAESTAGGGGPGERSTRTQEMRNFLNSKTRTTQVEEGGRLKRLSVAVVVDGTHQPGADGAANWEPRTAEEMDQIRALVRTAMGFNDQRGDQIEVSNMRFERPVFDDVIEEGGLPFGFESADLLRIVELLALAVVALILVFMVFRPMMKRLFTPGEPQQRALENSEVAGHLAPPDSAGAAAQTAQRSIPVQGQAQALPAPNNDVSRAIDIAQVHGQVKESSIKKVGEIISSHPEESVSILRNWLHQAT